MRTTLPKAYVRSNGTWLDGLLITLDSIVLSCRSQGVPGGPEGPHVVPTAVGSTSFAMLTWHSLALLLRKYQLIDLSWTISTYKNTRRDDDKMSISQLTDGILTAMVGLLLHSKFLKGICYNIYQYFFIILIRLMHYSYRQRVNWCKARTRLWKLSWSSSSTVGKYPQFLLAKFCYTISWVGLYKRDSYNH